MKPRIIAAVLFTLAVLWLLADANAKTAPTTDAATRVECDPVFIKHAEAAWMLTRMGTKTQEAGFRVEVVDGVITYSDVKMGQDGDMHMDIPVDSNTIAIFHTHPNTGVSHPVGKDFNAGVPNYVFSKDGLFVTEGQGYKHLSGCFVGKEYMQ